MFHPVQRDRAAVTVAQSFLDVHTEILFITVFVPNKAVLQGTPAPSQLKPQPQAFLKDKDKSTSHSPRAES